jgi:hypothetical protein
LHGSSDAFVAKLNSTGSGLIYATYLGGAQQEDGLAIALDGSGHAYVAGRTRSFNFPLTPGAFDTSCCAGTQDGFVAKLSLDGSALDYSTYIGGSTWDSANAIAVDASGHAYVAGDTASSDFATTAGAFDTTFNDGRDTFVSKLATDGKALDYSTFVGGSRTGGTQGIDHALGIALDATANAYVTGYTDSNDFPTTPGAFDVTHNGGELDFDVFVTKLHASGASLVYSTYLGGADVDTASAIALDAEGNAYVTGHTESVDFPTTAGAFQTTYKGKRDGFVTKLNDDGTALVYSAYLGGTEYDFGAAIAVDEDGFAYVTGQTASADFPTSAIAFDNTFNGTTNAFMTKLKVAGSGIVYSTYLGGSLFFGERGSGIAVDADRGVFVTGQSFSPDFPTTPGALKRRNRGAFVTKFTEA